VRALKAQLDFVGDCGVKLVNTHAGFIPEWPGDPLYAEVVHTLADLAGHARRRGITFCLETGQETPVTLKRAILDSGADNLGINLDPANLLMYGKANPVDAVGVFGEFVRSVHIKDGRYPRGDMRLLGDEMPVGAGMVDFTALLLALEEKGFDGPLIIEREISGEKQMEDIRRAMNHITPLLD
jgi:L-ribulose-5-phosphate 3-epimerase